MPTKDFALGISGEFSDTDVVLCPLCHFEYNHIKAGKRVEGHDSYKAGWWGRGDMARRQGKAMFYNDIQSDFIRTKEPICGKIKPVSERGESRPVCARFAQASVISHNRKTVCCFTWKGSLAALSPACSSKRFFVWGVNEMGYYKDIVFGDYRFCLWGIRKILLFLTKIG